MPIEISVSILTCLMGAGVLILLAGIPWAYSVHGRLTKIETSLQDRRFSAEQLTNLEHRVTRLEMKDQGSNANA